MTGRLVSGARTHGSTVHTTKFIRIKYKAGRAVTAIPFKELLQTSRKANMPKRKLGEECEERLLGRENQRQQRK